MTTRRGPCCAAPGATSADVHDAATVDGAETARQIVEEISVPARHAAQTHTMSPTTCSVAESARRRWGGLTAGGAVAIGGLWPILQGAREVTAQRERDTAEFDEAKARVGHQSRSVTVEATESVVEVVKSAADAARRPLWVGGSGCGEGSLSTLVDAMTAPLP